ncbi:hypothetical protein [Streptomyces parvulus]|uniref:hypothetical protein n=1 Tax=Streptomyces parvulus TaxID=146923 RepID=UPI0036FD57D5
MSANVIDLQFGSVLRLTDGLNGKFLLAAALPTSPLGDLTGIKRRGRVAVE